MPIGSGNFFSTGQKGQIHPLTNGRNDSVTFKDKLRTGNHYRTSTTTGICWTQLHPLTLQPHYSTIVRHNAHRCHEEMEVDILLLRLMDLQFVGGHLGSSSAVEQADIVLVHPQCGSHAVYGHVTATDHCHSSPLRIRVEILVDATQVLDTGDITLIVLIFTLDPCWTTVLRPYGNKNSVVFAQELGEQFIGANTNPVMDSDAQALDTFRLFP